MSPSLRTIAVALIALAARAAPADSWEPPPGGYYVLDNGYYVKVEGDSTLTLRRVLAMPPKGRDEWPKLGPPVWRAQQPNMFPPIWVFVTRDLNHAVLVDQYSMMGYGKTLTFIGPRGKTITQYELREMLPRQEIEHVEVSVSSIWWNDSALFTLADNDRVFAFWTASGTVRAFDVATGLPLAVSGVGALVLRDLVLPQARANLRSASQWVRIDGIAQVGYLADAASLPALKALLADPLSGVHDRYLVGAERRQWANGMREAIRKSIAQMSPVPRATRRTEPPKPARTQLYVAGAVLLATVVGLLARLFPHRATGR